MPGNKKPGQVQTGRVTVPKAAEHLEANHKESTDSNQPQSKQYLIGSLSGVRAWLDCCPYASTIVGKSLTLDAWVMIQIRCKRWGCRHCGERKMAHFANKVRDAKPNKFITLTVATGQWDNPRAAYDGTRRAVTQLAVKIRRRFGEFEYFRVLETTKKGWPHYHLIARSGYIPQSDLSDMWKELTGAHIVDIRKPGQSKHVYSYVMKYLGKQTHVPWTDRRLSWSRKFFAKEDFVKAEGLNLLGEEYRSNDPAGIAMWDYEGCILESYSRDCWIIKPPPPSHEEREKWKNQEKRRRPKPELI